MGTSTWASPRRSSSVSLSGPGWRSPAVESPPASAGRRISKSSHSSGGSRAMGSAVGPTDWLHPGRAGALLQALDERILVLDGAMGTMIQQHRLQEADYRGKRFADGHDREHSPGDHQHGPDCGCARDQRGNNDLLSLTRPELIRDIHLAYLAAGADLVETNTFNSTSVSLADYGLSHLARELNAAGARLARDACEAA